MNIFIRKMKTVVIGDIHGGLKGLEQALQRSNLPKKTKYIFIGDYVDGWSESPETIDFLIDFSQKNDCLFIRGNHDELLYNYLKCGEQNETWLQHGGESSKKAYQSISEKVIDKHLHFLENLTNYHIDEQNRLFVHAGFFSIHGPQFEYFPNLVYWDRTLWETACALDPLLLEDDLRYPKRLKLFKEIFIGHTPVTRIGKDIPVNFGNVWNVDTGAGFKGKVTVMDVDSKEFWQSEPVHTLYPTENGRN